MIIIIKIKIIVIITIIMIIITLQRSFHEEAIPVFGSDWRLDYSFLWMEENQRT